MLLLAAAVLLWFFPARWAVPLIAPRLRGLQLQQVHGLLWHGYAEQVRDGAGRDLGRVQWHLSRRAVLGQWMLQLDIEGPSLDFSGTVRRVSASEYEWNDVQARVALALLDQRQLAALSAPQGELRLTVDHALLQNGWPVQLQASGQWRDGVVSGVHGDVALGDWQWQAQARDGWIKAQFQNDGDAPLLGHGQAQASLLGWRLEATLQARQPDRALHQWLSRWGTMDASGVVHVERGGGLGIH